MGKKNVTFSDIAEYTHFSKTTISRYFNNPDSLTLENQQIIADALVKLNYKENKVARILANGKTEFIGLIIPNLYLSYYSEMVNEILSTYEKFGYKFLVFIGNENEETERRYIQELMAYKIEGLIILSHTIPSKELAQLQIPVVTIEREDAAVCSVNTDNYMGAVQATSLLIRNHCDVLIHVNSPTPTTIPAYQRIQGFIDVCEERQVPHQIIFKDFRNDFETVSSLMQEVFQEIEKNYANQKKGIFISNDTHANILLNLLVRKYGTLPEDYELIGFDGAPISAQAIIPISTIGQQIDKIALEAVSLLVEQMNERKKRRPVPLDKPIHKVITPVLIRRNTTS
ncbi:MAG: LacI family DNA-binding transcriptional regulator [Lachnospiraceae bacterium]